jgi:DMSO reductase anchor subunit
VLALPQAAFFLLIEAAVGGTIALFWVHLRGEVPRGFTLFTGACLWVCAALAIWLRGSFPPSDLGPTARLWFQAERVLSLAFVVLLAIYLLAVRARRPARSAMRWLGPLVPLVGLAALWCASLVVTGPQLGGLGGPLAELAGAIALGSALTGLSLGHWYLVSPSLSTQPLVRLTFVCIGAIACQIVLLPLLLFGPGAGSIQIQAGVQRLFSDDALFLGVRVVFGLLVPLVASLMTWRTARIRSLDSATGLLYIVSALVLAGEIAARTLFFQTGVAT